MANQKGRSVIFKLPRKINVGMMKAPIGSDISDAFVVFRDLGSD